MANLVSVRVLLLVSIACLVAALLPALGPVMHESDQASFLQGALRLAEGRSSPWSADFYNYDKQFATYWLLAAAERAFPGMDAVLLGNLLSFAVLWSGIFALVWRSHVRRPAALAAVAACVTAPAVLLHSLFLASTFLASGWLFWAWALWAGGAAHRWRRALALALFALAMGCRADVVLLVPFLAWQTMTPRRLAGCVFRPAPWALAAVAAAVLIFGRFIFPLKATDAYAPFFYPKVFAAFLIFGLGAAGLVLLVSLAAAARATLRRWARPSRWFYAAGALSFLLPALYYAGQLFSPRYWTVTICAQLIFVCSRRGAQMWAFRPGNRLVAAVLLTASLLPVVFGLRMASPKSVSLVTARPTLFPSADGMIPMGAFAWYLWKQRPAEGPFDHNQATWLAARSVDYEPDEMGSVPLLPTNLHTYMELAIEMQGKSSREVPAGNAWYYVDLRSLLRANNPFTMLPDSTDAVDLSTRGLEIVSKDVNGYRIVRGQPGSPTSPEILRDAALVRLFDGAEFEPPSRDFSAAASRAREGKSAVVFASAPFAVTVAGGPSLAAAPVKDLGYAVKLPAAELASATFPAESGDARISFARLPDYMNVQNLK